MELTDIYRTFHPPKEYTFFSSRFLIERRLTKKQPEELQVGYQYIMRIKHQEISILIV